MPRERPLSYDIRKFPGPTGIRHEAIFVCAGCDKKAILNIGEVHNPEKLANRLAKHGWRGTAWCPRRDIRCPECLRGKSETNDTTSELRKYINQQSRKSAMLMAADPEIAKAVHGAIAPEQPQENTDMARPKAPEIGNPTSDQRVAIRAALDKHFDDKQGIYLDGQSDEKIASELDFPRKWVSDIRDAAYGPIRENPAVTQLKAEIEAVRSEINADAIHRTDFEARIGRKLAELVDKVEAFGRSVR